MFYLIVVASFLAGPYWNIGEFETATACEAAARQMQLQRNVNGKPQYHCIAKR